LWIEAFRSWYVPLSNFCHIGMPLVARATCHDCNTGESLNEKLDHQISKAGKFLAF
jgi:hypothetical protein